MSAAGRLGVERRGKRERARGRERKRRKKKKNGPPPPGKQTSADFYASRFRDADGKSIFNGIGLHNTETLMFLEKRFPLEQRQRMTVLEYGCGFGAASLLMLER